MRNEYETRFDTIIVARGINILSLRKVNALQRTISFTALFRTCSNILTTYNSKYFRRSTILINKILSLFFFIYDIFTKRSR